MGYFKDKMITRIRMLGLSVRTEKLYIDRMTLLVKFFNCPPDKLSLNDINYYLSYLVNVQKVQFSTYNISINAIRFFYNKVMNNKLIIEGIHYQKKKSNFLPF
jgi:hypothetical protein